MLSQPSRNRRAGERHGRTLAPARAPVILHAVTHSPRYLIGLRAVCETFAPGAAALGVDAAAASVLVRKLDERQKRALNRLLAALVLVGLPRMRTRSRARVLRVLGLVPSAGAALDALRRLTLLLYYTLPDATGRNPQRVALGIPEPAPAPPSAAPPLPVLDPADVPAVLECDVCVVGSGAGGSVVAAELARAGLDVLVLEQGPAYADAELPADEPTAMRELYWRGGPMPTDDGTVTLLAGRTLGGGTTVNWMTCVAPPAAVRREWAHVHGLRGLDGDEFDTHLDAVLTRLGAREQPDAENETNRLLRAGAEQLGWRWQRIRRNVDPSRYDSTQGGFVSFGDRTGAKQSTPHTFLRDATDAGARVLARCRAERVLVDGARASGVMASVEEPGGAPRPLHVRANCVVVAGGALETPALLLRSGIGGSAVGRHLRLHPVVALAGVYERDVRPWLGAPQTVVVNEHATAEHGFIVEVPGFALGLYAASLPWTSAAAHGELMEHLPRMASFIAITHDRGSGSVTIDDAGRARVRYPLTDERDRESLRAGLAALARLHAAAGASLILDLASGGPRWRRGGDLDAFIRRMRRVPFEPGARSIFSAHQMGSARMGPDAATSVADERGELRDARGVWVADTSAFPSAIVVNPMVTCMALARRTAAAILAGRSAALSLSLVQAP